MKRENKGMARLCDRKGIGRKLRVLNKTNQKNFVNIFIGLVIISITMKCWNEVIHNGTSKMVTSVV